MTASRTRTPRWADAVGALRRLVVRRWPLPRGRDRVAGALLRALGTHAHGLRARTAFGAELRCDLRDLVQSRVYDYGVWEPNLTAFISSRLREGDVFVDVGANVGYFSLLASKLVGAAGAVVSIDASPRIFRRLEESLALNGAVNARTLNVAISDREGTLPVYLGNDDNLGQTSTLAERGGTFEAEVPARPLASVLTPEERARVALIKIDVEGAEGPVLGDLAARIDLYPALRDVVVEISPHSTAASGWPIARIIDLFAAAGFGWSRLENRYDTSEYTSGVVAAPVVGTEIPTEQVDVIFSRATTGTTQRGRPA